MRTLKFMYLNTDSKETEISWKRTCQWYVGTSCYNCRFPLPVSSNIITWISTHRSKFRIVI